jgi:hypothetical protein
MDISLYNILLDEDYNIKFINFIGCLINGSKLSMFTSIKFRHSKLPDERPLIQSELFALGSTLYKIETT